MMFMLTFNIMVAIVITVTHVVLMVITERRTGLENRRENGTENGLL